MCECVTECENEWVTLCVCVCDSVTVCVCVCTVLVLAEADLAGQKCDKSAANRSGIWKFENLGSAWLQV